MLRFILSLKDNPVFIGLVGTMIMGSIMYILKATPTKLWNWLFQSFSVRLTVTNTDEAFIWVNEWLSEHAYSNKARSLRVAPKPSDFSQWNISPGLGRHWIWDRGPILVVREINEKAGTEGAQLRETIDIYTFGRTQSRIRKLIEESKAQKTQKDLDKIKFAVFHPGWGWVQCPINKYKRDLSTVFLPKVQKSEIIDNIKWFLDNKKWFRDRGVPYRQGYLFYGPPGTGKSTLVASLAGHFDLWVCVLNLNSIATDEILLDAFRRMPQKSILLIEDIDCVGMPNKRAEPKTSKDDQTQKSAPESAPSKCRVTLSGILNAIDGVTTSEGHILIMTTNHIDKIDPAIIREGRVNKKIEISNMESEIVTEMAQHFFPDDSKILDIIKKETRRNKNKSPAYWQRRLMDLHAEIEVQDLKPKTK